VVPGVPVVFNRDDGEKSRLQQLLALQGLRRDLESFARPRRAARSCSVAVTDAQLASDLRELVEALDRRVSRVERAGEASIARDAAALRAKAMRRLADLGERKDPGTLATREPAATGPQ